VRKKVYSRRSFRTSLKKEKIVIVMPAYNAEKTLKKTLDDIPKSVVDDIILVDDGSHDKTVQLAKKLGLNTFVHPQNRGYGGNQKTCYTLALNEDADVVVMIHPDYQYDSSLTEDLIRPILHKRFDIVLGSRIRSRREALEGGMPLYKYFANRILTIIQNIVLGQNLSEYHTGFRAFDKKVLVKLPFHKFSDDFVFDQDILVSAVYENFKIGEVHVPVRYFPDASSINFQRSVKYGIEIFKDLTLFLLAKTGLYTSKIFSEK
jgi:glycosyltransferase involved in cell wall biosynthesis